MIFAHDSFFSFQKNGRGYLIGGKLFEIPDAVLKKFEVWNTPPQDKSDEIDKRFVLALLLVLVSENDILNGNISQDALTFISGRCSALFGVLFVDFLM